jgi:hypothetical protein
MKVSSAIAILATLLSLLLTMFISAATPLVAAPPAVVTPGTEVPTPTNMPQPTSTPTSTPTPTSIPVAPEGDPVVNISVEQEVVPDDVLVGEIVHLHVHVLNNSNQPGNGIVIDIPVPDGLELITVETSRGTVVISGRLVQVQLGRLLPGLREKITLITRARQPGVIQGSVSITTTDRSDLLPDNVDQVTLRVRELPQGAIASPTPTDVPPPPSSVSLPQPTVEVAVAPRLPNTGGADDLWLIGLTLLATMLLLVAGVVRVWPAK